MAVDAGAVAVDAGNPDSGVRRGDTAPRGPPLPGADHSVTVAVSVAVSPLPSVTVSVTSNVSSFAFLISK